MLYCCHYNMSAWVETPLKDRYTLLKRSNTLIDLLAAEARISIGLWE